MHEIMTNITPSLIKQEIVADSIVKTKQAKKANVYTIWIFISFAFVILNAIGVVYAVYFLMTFYDARGVILLDTNKILHTTSDKFLSIALDTSIIEKGWRKFDLDSPAVVNMVSALSPSYLRFGGTASDCLIFDSSPNENAKANYPVDGESCIFGYEDCELFRKNFTMSETDWLKINKFAKVAGLDLIFDLNVLLRDGEGWDSSNALKLIKFSRDNQFIPSWQLGNEPNSFNYVFNKKVSGVQLAKDFSKLRDILDAVFFTHVKLLGPDVTRPRLPKLDAVSYLIDFLKEINKQEKEVIDAVTWHHYNLNGRESTLKDYIDLSNFQQFYVQLQLVTSVVTLMKPGLPVWITETSDAFGGGAPNITDRFVGGFLWMDKLGSAAANGIQVLARQSIFGGYYALIDKNLNPTPDFWLSVLYKKLVGPKVISTTIRDRKPCNVKKIEYLKFYAHCAPHAETYMDGEAVTIFGYNTGPYAETLVLDCDLEIREGIKVYILTGEDGIQSRYTLLNGKRLELNKDGTLPPLIPVIQKKRIVTIPPFSMVFWQIYGVTFPICG